MPLADYAHWNEEAEQVWWQEEGRHAETDAANARADAMNDDGYYDDHPPDGCE
jgi:hypothetical protein